MMVTVGLTGGIASGKTLVARMFRDLGAQIIDADEIARQVVEPGSVGLARIQECFGPGMLTADGRLDRARMGADVFCDQTRLQKLNSLLHPLIAEQIAGRLERLRSSGFEGLVVVDVPLLIECGWQDMFDRTIVVYCDPDEQRRRLMSRNGLDSTQAAARIASQMPLREKKTGADFVIDNQSDPQALRSRVEDIYARLRPMR
jgi:dephospho-CoA kinase